MLKQIGNETNVATAVQMLADAQAAWTAQADTHDVGPFAPVFIFNRADAVQYGPINTFGWNGPDPNTGWVGYQFRPLAELAELVFACNGSEAYYAQAVGVVDTYLHWLDWAWTTAVTVRHPPFRKPGPRIRVQSRTRPRSCFVPCSTWTSPRVRTETRTA